MKNVTGDALSIKAGGQKHPSIWRAGNFDALVAAGTDAKTLSGLVALLYFLQLFALIPWGLQADLFIKNPEFCCFYS